jgi:hypothetical protein
MFDSGNSDVGSVFVQTTSGRGFTPEEVAERCLNKIIAVSEDANPVIRKQADAFKNHIRAVLVFYMKQAISSDRTTVYNALLDAGQKDLAETIRRL